MKDSTVIWGLVVFLITLAVVAFCLDALFPVTVEPHTGLTITDCNIVGTITISPHPGLTIVGNIAEPDFEDMLDAIEWVESKGDPWAVGDDGKAVGAYQIHKIYVDDVNRITRPGIITFKERFTYKERSDPEKSRRMVTIYLNHYGGTFEEMAAKHVAGPDGHNQMNEPRVKAYIKKVMERMESVK